MIKVLKLHEDAQLPKVAHPGEDLAWDIYAVEDAVVRFGKVTTVSTGIAVQMESGIKAGFILRERSSQGKQGIKLLGGVIDPCYQGEWKVMLTSLNADHVSDDETDDTYKINKGDRIAQAICLPTLTGLPIDWTEAFASNSERGDKGFGSTGR